MKVVILHKDIILSSIFTFWIFYRIIEAVALRNTTVVNRRYSLSWCSLSCIHEVCCIKILKIFIHIFKNMTIRKVFIIILSNPIPRKIFISYHILLTKEFFILFQFFENYWIFPKILRHFATVHFIKHRLLLSFLDLLHYDDFFSFD